MESDEIAEQPGRQGARRGETEGEDAGEMEQRGIMWLWVCGAARCQLHLPPAPLPTGRPGTLSSESAI